LSDLKKICRKEPNKRDPEFDVAAVTVEISAISIRFDCNRRLLCGWDRAAQSALFQLKDQGLSSTSARAFWLETLRPMSSIVIYEADDLMRGLLQEWLTRAGYRVSTATPCGPPPDGEADLVIVNIGMPKHAGSRAADKIRAAHPGTPIIAISAQFRADLSTAGTTARILGVAQVIAKPLRRDALLAAVSAIIAPAFEKVRAECPTTAT
jgi:CheY-like chemotaxis protein